MIGDILQPTHLLFVLVVALLVLGPKRLPEAGRALGKGIRDFKSAMSGEDDHNGSIPAETTPRPRAPAVDTDAAPARVPRSNPSRAHQPALRAAERNRPPGRLTEGRRGVSGA